MKLQNKRILLGLTGGIAAYKCAELVRRLKDQGADVRVVMTAGAKEFITPLTLQALSGNPVADSLLDPSAEAAMGHIELARWADLILVAPATANFIASLNAGLSPDLLGTLCLATSAPIAIAPAMNQQMYKAQATQDNLASLARRGVQIWGPDSGEQACGDVGPGRMLEPAALLQHVIDQCNPGIAKGIRVLLTAGPTREAIDPVRYISNHSSGKMGYAIAQAAAQMGATVTLVSGPVALNAPANVERIDVTSADDMYQAVINRTADCDIFIGCAAVADYRPTEIADQKIKKSSSAMGIELTRNVDILAEVAKHKQRPFCVGFAAETQDVEKYARGKLQRKNLDLIAANNVATEGQGFNADNNALTLFWQDGQQELPLCSKQQLAQQLFALTLQHYQQATTSRNP